MSDRISLTRFIREHRAEIDAETTSRYHNDEERRLWIINDEDLYLWARKLGAKI